MLFVAEQKIDVSEIIMAKAEPYHLGFTYMTLGDLRDSNYRESVQENFAEGIQSVFYLR